MNDRVEFRPITVSIAAVERDTGLSKDTLRVWERRYGFPAPQRDTFDERAYPLDQVEKLRVIKRLLDSGHRPGRVVQLDMESLQALGEALPASPQPLAGDEHTDLLHYIDLIKSHDVDGLRRALTQVSVRMGVSALVTQVIAPLNVMVGDAWMRGQLEVFEEHMYTECIQVLLRQAVHSAPDTAAAASPRILLTTFPQEPHGLGLLMAQAMLSLEGCKCISLGTQTPLMDMVLAATAHRCDVLALSFTASQNSHYVVNGLQELRQKLPAKVDIWAGGSCPVLHRRSMPGITTIANLSALGYFVNAWRAQHN